jgi:ribosomal protein S27E
MTLKDPFDAKTTFEVVNNSGRMATVRCETCGHKQVMNKELAVIQEAVICGNCGRENSFNNHIGLVLLITIAIVVYVKLKSIVKRTKTVILGCD